MRWGVDAGTVFGGRRERPQIYFKARHIGGPFLFLEPSMKSEYHQAVESVIAQEAKLAEVAKLHADATAREKQLSEALRFNLEVLARYEARVAELEPTAKEPAHPGLQGDIKEINASLKFLCRELMRPET